MSKQLAKGKQSARRERRFSIEKMLVFVDAAAMKYANELSEEAVSRIIEAPDGPDIDVSAIDQRALRQRLLVNHRQMRFYEDEERITWKRGARICAVAKELKELLLEPSGNEAFDFHLDDIFSQLSTMKNVRIDGMLDNPGQITNRRKAFLMILLDDFGSCLETFVPATKGRAEKFAHTYAICVDLAGTFEEFFGRDSAVPNSKGGKVTGPYVRFLQAFFRETGRKVPSPGKIKSHWVKNKELRATVRGIQRKLRGRG